jgi:hypothetical protein
MSDNLPDQTYDVESILKVAEQIRAAIERKLPDYKIYMRFHDTAHFQYIEMAAQPVKNPTPLNEVQTAHSVGFYAGMVDADTKVQRGRRVLRDLMIVLGLPVEPVGDAAS